MMMNHPTPATAVQPQSAPADEPLRTNLIAALRTIYDPEIPVNIYDLGLIYALNIDAEGKVDIDMTLTAPACPVAATFPAAVEARLSEVPGVSDAHVTLVWEPPWNIDMLPHDVRLQLGLL
jgi:FeS assembly SUF system protein